jgi:hypothetical protein
MKVNVETTAQVTESAGDWKRTENRSAHEEVRDQETEVAVSDVLR